MSKREEYEQKTEELLEPIVSALGFELVDVEYVKEAGTWYLRAYIDKPGGITVDDCEAVSRKFSDILDEKDYIPDSYVFAIASNHKPPPLVNKVTGTLRPSCSRIKPSTILCIYCREKSKYSR